MRKICALAAVFAVIGFAAAQEADGNASLEDELFGGDSEAVVTPEQANAENEKDPLRLKGDLNSATLSLENTKLRIGGSLNSELGLKYVWEDPYTKKDNYKKAFLNPQNAVLQPTLGASLFFDARPIQNLKLYGKFLFAFPFEKSLNGTFLVPKSLVPPNGTEIPINVNGSPNIKIWELYTRIDPQKPTEDREGPVSLRTHIVIPKTQYNIWLYLLPDTADFKPQHTAAAAKAEFVFGDWELGLGGWYRYEKAPRFITTLSGSIAGKVAVFAEGVFAWGSDYTYYKNDAAFTAYPEKDKPFFQATLGGAYSNAKSHTSLSFQYYYNGFGYTNTTAADSILLKATEALSKKRYNDPAIEQSRDIYAMGNRGQHYIALTLSQNKIGTEKLSADLFQQFAITELEGLTTLSLNWKIYKFIQMSTGPAFSYPLSPDSLNKGSISYNLSFKLGGGKF